MLKEEKIVNMVREYLISKGYEIKNHDKKNNEHGCDVITKSHKSGRKNYYIEVKGEGTEKSKEAVKNNAFWTLFGQILSRMDIGGNDATRGRIYAIAIPANWEKTFKNKIKKMEFGWQLLKLRVFLVSEENGVIEVDHKYFLK
jgi:hypothetical protein